MISMTGFASLTTVLEDHDAILNVSMSIKTVNGRYFEATCRLPSLFADQEAACIKLCKQVFVRSTVTLQVSYSWQQSPQACIRPQIPVVQAYMQALKDIGTAVGTTYHPDVRDIIDLPYIFESGETSLSGTLAKQFLQNIEKLVGMVQQQREREGQALTVDIAQRCDTIARLWASIEPHTERIAQQERDSFKKALEQLGAQPDEGVQQKIIESLSAHLEKLDVHEEVVRFKTHLDSLVQTIQSAAPEKGRKLDFTLQEMLREANTLSAKCHDTAISQIIIDVKVELEKVREQIQNIV